MCCKLFPIPVLDKADGQWCSYCKIGQGCRIYEHRPGICRDFYCEYLINKDLGERWKPSVSRLVVTKSIEESLCRIHVDRDRKDGWKRKPYIADIQRWANQAAAEGVRVVVICDGHATEIAPRSAAAAQRRGRQS
jgi:hypothetical protein